MIGSPRVRLPPGEIHPDPEWAAPERGHGGGVSRDPLESDARCAACSHERAVHEHCRPGTDCGLCACDRFRVSLRGLVAGLLTHRRPTARV